MSFLRLQWMAILYVLLSTTTCLAFNVVVPTYPKKRFQWLQPTRQNPLGDTLEEERWWFNTGGKSCVLSASTLDNPVSSSYSTSTSSSTSSSTSTTHTLDEVFVWKQMLMPSTIERALIHGDTSMNAMDILDRVDLSNADRQRALEALHNKDPLHVVNVPATLTPTECQKLRTYVSKRMRDDGGIDDVDGCPDYQVQLSVTKLRQLIGSNAMERLWTIPTLLSRNDNKNNNNKNDDIQRVGIFLRMYRPYERPWMPFHIDSNTWTVNVALNSDEEFVGGKLLLLHRNQLQKLHRQEGDATCHLGSVVHGVSAIVDGTRYSMILFFHT